MKAANNQAVTDVTAVCATFGISISKEYWRVPYEANKNFNAVTVDFN
jgi:hypothetical protein